MEDKEINSLIEIINKRKRYLVVALIIVATVSMIFNFIFYMPQVAMITLVITVIFIAIDKVGIIFKLDKVLMKNHREEFQKYKKSSSLLNSSLNISEIFIRSSYFKNVDKSEEMDNLRTSVENYNKWFTIYLKLGVFTILNLLLIRSIFQ